MNLIAATGFLAGCFTTFCYLPQVIRIWKIKETRDLSLLMCIGLVVGTALWLIYGVALNQPPIWLANGVSLILTGSILYLKLKHG